MINNYPSILIAAALSIGTLSGCETVQYVQSEVAGTAKPEGGIAETISATKSFKASPKAVRRAVLSVLDDQGYIYEENPSTRTIKTEPHLLTDPSKVMFLGASYSDKLFIKLDGSSVTLRAKFNKQSNLTMGEQNIDYPEKENELRKAFFDALSRKLGTK